VGRAIVETSRYFAAAGCDVTLLTDAEVPALTGQVEQVIMPGGAALKHWTAQNKFTRLIRQFLQVALFSVWGTVCCSRSRYRSYICLNHNVDILRGDVIIVQNVFWTELVGDLRRSRRKFVRLLNPLMLLRLLRERFVLGRKRNGVVIVVSERTRREAQRFVHPGTVMHIIPNGTDLNQFRPVSNEERTKVRALHGAGPEEFLLLFVGHEFERKGLAFLLDALRLLPSNVKLWVIGGRLSSQADYEARARRLDVAERVRFWGTRFDAEEFYRLADAFVLPSAYETFAIVGVEALASGLPVLMTAQGGVREYLRDGENGFFIEMDAADIATKVARLLRDASLCTRMTVNARVTAQQYSWQAAAEKYLTVIRGVARRRSGDV
jgi:glycosyltransferase involved in cell wall biosynthesis